MKIPTIQKVKGSRKKEENGNDILQKDNQIIAVWGSPGSGKSILTVKIAKELAMKKKNVMIICDDIFCPTIPIILPTLKNEEIDRSLGKIFSSPVIDQNIIIENSITIKHNDYIAMLGYQKGENVVTYPEYVRERIIDFLILLRHLVDYIIVDCSSIITESILTATALEFADKVIRLSTADFKGLSYFKSTLPLLMDSRFKVEEHLRVVSNIKDFQAGDAVNDVLRGSKILLPHTFEIEKQYTEGRLFESLIDKNSEGYKEELGKIMKEVFYYG